MKWLRFILSHSLFISLCAFSLCWQTFILLHVPVNTDICLLVFFATLGSYNFYWLISKYHFSDKRGLVDFLSKNISNVIVLLTAFGGIIYIYNPVWEVMPVIIISVLLTLAYSLPLWPFKQLTFIRRAGFLKTVLLAFTWTYVTIMFPVTKAGIYINTPVILLFTARFLFMLMLCIIFDSRDVTVDKIHSLSSLATAVSKRTLGIIITFVFFIYLSAGFLLRYYFEDNAQVAAFFVTGIAVLAVYRLSLQKQGYFFYYFLVDGLMLFSATATFVASI